MFVVLGTNKAKNKMIQEYLEFLSKELIIIVLKKDDLSNFFLEFFNFEQ